MRIAILTANTDIYREKEEDKAGTVIRKLVEMLEIMSCFRKRCLQTGRFWLL